MTRPRVIAVTTLAFALLAGGSADAATTYSLDGRRTRTAKYNGSLDESTMPSTTVATRSDPLAPELSDCTPASCDIRELRLTLPKNTSWGRFRTTVTVPAQLQATLVLFDAKGDIVAQQDSVDSPPADVSYVLAIHVERLARGQYTLALVNRAGMGAFEATVGWVAHPQDRYVI